MGSQAYKDLLTRLDWLNANRPTGPFETELLLVCSQLGVRDPEYDSRLMVCHSSIALFFWLVCESTKVFLKFVLQIAFGVQYASKFPHLPSAEYVLVAPRALFHEGSCSYFPVELAAGQNASWLMVFSHSNFFVYRKLKLHLIRLISAFRFFMISTETLRSNFGHFENLRVVIYAVRALLSPQSLRHLELQSEVETFLSRSEIKRFYLAHEFHGWARMTTALLKQAGRTSMTFQHASVNKSKLWYFPRSEDLRRVNFSPSRIYCLSGDERYFATSADEVCIVDCLPRWSGVSRESFGTLTGVSSDLLFRDKVMVVGSMSAFHNACLVDLCGSRSSLGLTTVYRPHPNPQYLFGTRLKLMLLIFTRKVRVAHSAVPSFFDASLRSFAEHILISPCY